MRITVLFMTLYAMPTRGPMDVFHLAAGDYVDGPRGDRGVRVADRVQIGVAQKLVDDTVILIGPGSERRVSGDL